MSASQSSWDLYNGFLLHGAVDRFSKLLARYELFRKVIDLPGDIVEGGVFKGSGVLFWAKLLQIFCPLSERRVLGFDTFSGYPSESMAFDVEKALVEAFVAEASYEPVSPEAILEVAAEQGLEKRIELIKGDATTTIPEYVRSNRGFRIALLHLDFDAYTPTKAALESMFPLVVSEGIIAFDEYGVRGWGESDAVDEFFRSSKAAIRAFPWASGPTGFVVKT